MSLTEELCAHFVRCNTWEYDPYFSYDVECVWSGWDGLGWGSGSGTARVCTRSEDDAELLLRELLHACPVLERPVLGSMAMGEYFDRLAPCGYRVYCRAHGNFGLSGIALVGSPGVGFMIRRDAISLVKR